MSPALLLVWGLFAVVADDGPKPADLAAYEQLRAHAERGAEAQVKLALWCEAHGLKTERLKHLAVAVLADPANATARGLMGLVAYDGQWKRPIDVAEKVKADAKLAATLAEYNARRGRTPGTADAQWKLALWCEENGLGAEAQAHFSEVVRLDPTREAAWKRLGCKKVGGRWVTQDQVAAEKAETETQKAADQRWKPLLTLWRAALGDKNKAKRQEAEQALAAVSDPRAVPSVWSVFMRGKKPDSARTVQLLGQIDAVASSRALAFLAVVDTRPEVRRAATETLKRRDPREFGGFLVGLLRDPIKYEVRPIGGPGSPGAIFVEGEQFNVERIYAPPAFQMSLNSPKQLFTVDRYGIPEIYSANEMMLVDGILQGAVYRSPATNGKPQLVPISPAAHAELSRMEMIARARTLAMMNEIQNVALTAQQQLTHDVQVIETYNEQCRQTDARVSQVLTDIAGQNLGTERQAWQGWFVNQIGYAAYEPSSTPKPTIVEDVPLAYIPARVEQFTWSPQKGYSNASCFGAGTLVRTLNGTQSIETLKVGDRVLTQSVRDGALGYRPVVDVHHNPPSPTFLVKVNGDTVVSSPFHRFWVTGKGWVMARDLKGGETLRLLDGPAKVELVSEGPVQKVYNLDVADDHDFFAGRAAALVHDNTLPDTRLTPFDAPPDLAAANTPARTGSN